MTRTTRRARGIILRVAHRRPVAIAVGAALIGFATILWIGDYGWESWLTDGAALVAGATGAALVLFATAARRADWEDGAD